MRRSICELTKPSARRELRLAGISTSTTADVHIRVLTAAPRIKPTSTRCHSAWQPKPGRGSTYRRGDFVQTSGTSSFRRCARHLLQSYLDDGYALVLATSFLFGAYHWWTGFGNIGEAVVIGGLLMML